MAGNAGFASLIAGLLLRTLSPRITVAVVAALPPFAFTLAAALMMCSLAASFLMPGRTDLVRNVRGEDDPPLAPQVALLLVALGGLAMLQVPSLTTWGREELTILQSGLGEGVDPLGLNLVPMTIVLALPAVAALTLALFVVTSVLAIVAPSTLASRVLGSCVLLQAGYIVGAYIVIGELRTIREALAPLLADDATAARQVSEWMTRYDAAASTTTLRLALTCLGYVVAALVAYSSRAAEQSLVTDHSSSNPSSSNP